MNQALRLLALLLSLSIAGGARAADTTATATIDPDGVQRLTVTLDSYSYSPSHLIVEADRPVELTLVSISTMVTHNLILDDPASGLSLKQNVGADKTVKLQFTPTRPGTFVFFCDKKAPFMASHREKGMEGTLEVRAQRAP